MNSMVYCRGCGKEIHSTAPTCPHCGAPQREGAGKALNGTWVALVLMCFFVGFLGVHRFYVGKIGTGILMILTFGGLGLWVLIDLIMILCGLFSDKEGRAIPNSV